MLVGSHKTFGADAAGVLHRVAIAHPLALSQSKGFVKFLYFLFMFLPLLCRQLFGIVFLFQGGEHLFHAFDGELAGLRLLLFGGGGFVGVVGNVLAVLLQFAVESVDRLLQGFVALCHLVDGVESFLLFLVEVGLLLSGLTLSVGQLGFHLGGFIALLYGFALQLGVLLLFVVLQLLRLGEFTLCLLQLAFQAKLFLGLLVGLLLSFG